MKSEMGSKKEKKKNEEKKRNFLKIEINRLIRKKEK